MNIIMKIRINKEDYAGIVAEVKKQIKLLPNNEFAQAEDLIIGPEFLANTLRVSTPKTEIDFEEHEKTYLKTLRATLKNVNAPNLKEQLEQLDSIVLFGQLIFAQSASLHFLKKIASEKEEIKSCQEKLSKLANNNIVQLKPLSKLDLLKQREEFTKTIEEFKKLIASEEMATSIKKDWTIALNQAKGFYYQVNDLNFKHANKPSRNFSYFMRTLEKTGSRVALGASIIALSATALSFIPVLTPIMTPIAMTASLIALGSGLPVSLKKIGTMIYNAIRFGVAPTKGEIINTVLLALCALGFGAGMGITNAIAAGDLGQYALLIKQGVKAAGNVSRAILGTIGQVAQHDQKKKTHEFFKVRNNLMCEKEDAIELMELDNSASKLQC